MRFLVLPDHPLSAAVVGGLVRGAPEQRILSHASGRPWIVGSWTNEDILTVSHGSRRLALLGCMTAEAVDLGRRLDHVRDVTGLDPLLRSVPGSYHAVASIDGRVRVQGSLSGIREVFHTTVDGITLVADRPDTLADLTGRDIDEQSLLCHLMAQQPWPLSERAVWRDVACPGPGRYVLLLPDGGHRTVRWWVPPVPEDPIAQGARRVQTALRDAVAARVRTGTTLGCDLSGGIDSTSLAFLSAREERCHRLVTVRREAEDPANDDAVWARYAAGALPTVHEAVVLPRSEVPYSFADQLDLDDDLEAPYAWTRAKAVTAQVSRHLATRGVRTHLAGHGGDELFNPAPSFYHSLVRTSPLRSLEHLRAARSMYRWPLGTIVRNLLRAPTYGRWLSEAAVSVTQPVEGPRQPLSGWGHHPKLPAWVTPAAADTARALLHNAAEQGTAPHSPCPAQHEVLQAVRQCGVGVRLTDRLTSRAGVTYHAPYLDDQVVEAALAVRLLDRSSPRHTKPVLAAALRGTVPDPILDRTTKGEFSAEVYAGVRRHKRELLELADGMLLARLGLVDDAAVRAVILAPHPTSRTFIPMVFTLACESWLRSLESARTRQHSPEGTR
ncbi:asparagine synthase-related protein [Streptomyces afghaniensis]|uniref:asparagine synthase-related protein n=1 Tax=Streptomyces afghaniensis TaxID=66865 RepID=UPI00379079C4